MPDGGVIIALDDDEWTEASSEYSAARRDFIHDAERLDNGHKAELILAPVDEEAPEQRNLVSANRKIVLLVLLFINTSDRTLPEAERIAEAVKLSGLDGGTLRTYIRELNRALKSPKKTTKNLRFSEAECAFYTQMYKKTKDIARREGNVAIASAVAMGDSARLVVELPSTPGFPPIGRPGTIGCIRDPWLRAAFAWNARIAARASRAEGCVAARWRASALFASGKNSRPNWQRLGWKCPRSESASPAAAISQTGAMGAG